MCGFFFNIRYQNAHSAGIVRTVWGGEDILARPRNFKGLFEGQGLVLHLEFRLGFNCGKESGVIWDGSSLVQGLSKTLWR